MSTFTLLAKDEPDPVVVHNADGASPLFLTCDHAGKRIPRRLGVLGLPTGELVRHIAWDIGALGVARSLARALDVMLDAPEQPHTLESVAKAAGMSRSAFSERFGQAFGRSAMELLREVRLDRGAELLRATELSVQAVAEKVGFSSRSHFSRAFRGKYGVDPAGFRAAARDG